MVIKSSKHSIIVAMDWLISVQWYAMMFPLGGVFASVLCIRFNRARNLILISDIMFLFSVAWILLGMFIWMAQFTLIMSYMLTGK